MPDGSRHTLQFYGFPESFTGDGTGYYPWDYRGITGCTNYPSLSGNIQTFTSDGTYIRVDASSGSGTWTAYLPDGTTVTNCTTGCANGVPEQVIADRNGNKITIRSGVLTDDLGRTVTINGLQVTQAGYGSQPLTWTFGPAPNSNATSFSFQYICIPSTGTACAYTEVGGGTDQLQVPSNDPNNPLIYTFHYAPLSGELQTVTLPTGASTTYSYQCSNYEKCFNVFLQNAVTGKQVVWYDQADGGNTQRVENWSYSWSNTSSGTLFTKTAPDGGRELSYLGAGPGIETGIGTLTTRLVQPSGDSVDYFYEGNRPYGLAYPQGASSAFNPWLDSEVHNVSASNGSGTLSSVTLYTADKNGNQLTAKTYDWVSYSSLSRDSNGALTSAPGTPGSALLHSTQNSYTVTTSAEAGTGAESISDDTHGYWNPASPKFLHLLSRSVLTGTTPNAAISEFTYDAKANPTQERHWDSTKAPSQPSSLNSSNASVTSYAFDGYGNLTQLTDPANNVTQYTYDSNNLYLSKKVQAAGTSVARTFNYAWDFDSGLMISKTDADNSVWTSYAYDATGRITNVTEARNLSGPQTNTIYDDANRRVIVQRDLSTSGDGLLVSVTNYDQLGRIALTQELENASAQSPADLTAGIKVQTRYLYSGSSYKLVSNPYREANSSAAGTACNNNYANCAMGWTLTTMDQSGRVVSTQSFDGSGPPAPWGSNANSSGSVSTSYNAQYTTVTDQAGKTRQNSVDGAGRLTSVVEDPGSAPHLNYSTTYSYDTLDNLNGVNQSGMGRSFAYDSLKRLTQATNPESGTTSYAYDNDGNLSKKTDARNIAINYSYDALNRITSKTYSDGTPAVTYSYDGGVTVPFSAGRLIQTSNGISTTNVLAYDAMGRVTAGQQITNGQIYNFAYTYNMAGSLISETYPSGRVMNNSYDGADRVSEVFGGLGTDQTTYVNSVAYAAHGGVSSFFYGNSLARLFTYNPQLQLNSIADTVNNSPSGYLFATYPNWGTGNDNGNLQSAQAYEGGPSSLSSIAPFSGSYTYDGANRLTSATDSGGWSRIFQYDAYGNVWVTSNSGVPLNGMTPTSDVYNSGTNRINGVSYDAAGNQTVVGSYSIAYDAENRQITALDNTTQGLATYVYDGDGRRVQKIIQNGPTTTYVYDTEGKLVAEYSSAAPPSSVCYTCYLSSDHLGSTRLFTGETANVIARHDYLPFGEEIPANTAGRNSDIWGPSADIINQKFTGKERDQETGLDYFQARYYGSALERFTSPDAPFADEHPANPQSWNLYGYVRNNPLTNTDPTGRDCFAGLSNCADYILGGLKALANTAINVNNAVNHVVNGALSPLTSYQFPDVPTFHATDEDQRQGMEAANVTMLAAPALGIAGAASSAPSIATNAADSSFVFYSGPGARAAADAWSAANNGITIGMTEFGQAIENGTMTAEAASEAFANSASGTVQVFSNDPLTNYGNIWYNYELPALARNPDVTDIVINVVPKISAVPKSE